MTVRDQGWVAMEQPGEWWPARPRDAYTRVDWRGDTYPSEAIPGVDTWNGEPIPVTAP